jgi:V8-like Glu-specific endopeptidase
MKNLVLVLGLILAAVAGSPTAHAFPLTSKNWTEKSLINPFYTPGFNFQGIIALSNCSGSLVRFTTSAPTDKAMMLTNGHCVSRGPFGGMIQPGEVIVNESASYNVDLLDPSGNSIMSLTSSRILYATMTSTDVGLFELTNTYAEIEAKTGTHALIIADHLPAMGMDIQIPSGYWKRTYACQTEAIIPELHEADWTFKRSIRYSQPGCETIGGTSGSPLVSAQTGEVIGINNTGNEDGEECTINNPCEIDESGNKTVRKGRSYGQQTYLFYGCLSAPGSAERFDLKKPGCELPKP